ncbi:uncharacterized protein BJX67DRAFT_59649 [Aspergillus lucknowensis]|uniref:Uncharacterized protein n=1 Tax=Aspergillus lucknowensis TaxID=176173 RepID=A0ABR4LU45_9EURO
MESRTARSISKHENGIERHQSRYQGTKISEILNARSRSNVPALPMEIRDGITTRQLVSQIDACIDPEKQNLEIETLEHIPERRKSPQGGHWAAREERRQRPSLRWSECIFSLRKGALTFSFPLSGTLITNVFAQRFSVSAFWPHIPRRSKLDGGAGNILYFCRLQIPSIAWNRRRLRFKTCWLISFAAG